MVVIASRRWRRGNLFELKTRGVEELTLLLPADDSIDLGSGDDGAGIVGDLEVGRDENVGVVGQLESLFGIQDIDDQILLARAVRDAARVLRGVSLRSWRLKRTFYTAPLKQKPKK